MKIKFGAAIFQDKESPGIATAAIAGGDGGRRVRGTEDLPSDTVWLTDLSDEVMYARRLNNNARMRSKKYLRLGFDQILAATGIDEDTMPLEDYTQVVADLFSRVVRTTQEVLGFDHIPAKSLKQGIREHLYGKDPFMDENLVKVLTDATKYYTNCQQMMTQILDEKTFFLPPVEHARDILTTSVPKGKWSRIPKGKIPGSGGDYLGWLMHNPPGLVRVAINQINPSMNALLNYGDDLQASKVNRQWVTSHELISLLNNAAEITIHDAYLPESYTNHQSIVDAITEKYSEECNTLSLSWGLFWDNLWTGISSGYRRKQKDVSLLSANAVSPFMRAHDRLLCMSAAMKLQAEGLDILSYGTGKVVVNGAGIPDTDLFRIARETGLIPPAGRLQFDHLELKEKDLADPLTILQALYACGDYQQILDSDKQIVEEVILEAA